MSADPAWPCFIDSATDGPSAEPRIRWGRKGALGYRVLRLLDEDRRTRLPGEDILLEPETLAREAGARRLILGERASGMSDLRAWWRTTLQKNGQPYLLVRGVTPDARFVEGWPYPEEAGAHPAFEAGAHPAFEAFASAMLDDSASSAPEDAIDPVREALGAKGKTLSLIFSDAIEPSVGRLTAFAKRLRALADRAGRIELLILAQSETGLTASLDASGMLNLVDSMRLPSLRRAEVEMLRVHYDLNMRDTSVDTLLDATGGQPALVQIYLRALKRKVGPGPIHRSHIERVTHGMHDRSPQVAKHWLEELRRILEYDQERGSGELTEVVRGYLEGGRRGRGARIRDIERPLYIAGWVGPDRAGRWAIRSKFHAALARPLIHQLREAR